jgi:hypothetical protein
VHVFVILVAAHDTRESPARTDLKTQIAGELYKALERLDADDDLLAVIEAGRTPSTIRKCSPCCGVERHWEGAASAAVSLTGGGAKLRVKPRLASPAWPGRSAACTALPHPI